MHLEKLFFIEKRRYVYTGSDNRNQIGLMWNVKECWSNRKTGKNRLCNVIGILSFFLSGARVIDQGLQEIGEFAEKGIEF